MTAKIVGIRKSYIDGEFVDGRGTPFTVDNPYTEEIIAEVESVSLDQTADAIAAARCSFDSGVWSGLRREERVEAVAAIADYLTGRREELAETLVAETGAPFNMIATAHLDLPIRHARQAAEMYLGLPEFEHTPRPIEEVVATNRVAASIMRYEPVGVVAALVAYNVPLWISGWKVFPALLTGNTVILRPSPLAPLAALVFGEAADAVGLPRGVLNVVAES